MLIQKEIEKDVSIEKVIFHNLKSIEKRSSFFIEQFDVFGNDIIGYKFSKNISCFNKDFDRIWTF